MKKVLFISGSIGLGHITRDLAIARELKSQNPNIEIAWIANHHASLLIQESGEYLHPKAFLYANDNIPAERAAQKGKLNLLNYLRSSKKEWLQNLRTFREVIDEDIFDLIIGDETYEILIGLKNDPNLKKAPFVMINDFIGLDSMSNSLLEKLEVYMWNRAWASLKNIPDLSLFTGEEEDIPDRKFGFMLPGRRDWAKESFEFVGYVIPFNAENYRDNRFIREKLGYGNQPLIICSAGGTSAGQALFELFGKAYRYIKEKFSDVQMVFACGPRLDIETLRVPKEIDLRGYVPNLYEHYAACDLAIVMGGGTTTLELTALNRPFLYFPLEEHCEQQLNVVPRIERHGAGVKMLFSQTTPRQLADQVIKNIGKEVNCGDIPFDGAQKSAHLIQQWL